MKRNESVYHQIIFSTSACRKSIGRIYSKEGFPLRNACLFYSTRLSSSIDVCLSFFVAFLLRHLVFFAKKKIVTNSKSTKTVREDRLHRLDEIFFNENLQVAP